MKIYEKRQLPVACEACEEKDCAACDYAAQRFFILPADELRAEKKAAEKAIERLQRRIKEINQELEEMESAKV